MFKDLRETIEAYKARDPAAQAMLEDGEKRRAQEAAL